MKFIINESMIERVVSLYLDNEEFHIKNLNKKFNNYIYLMTSPDDEYAKISVYNKNAFSETRNWIFIDPDLIQEISAVFKIDKFDSMNQIGEWVQRELQIKSEKIINAEWGGAYRLMVQ